MLDSELLKLGYGLSKQEPQLRRACCFPNNQSRLFHFTMRFSQAVRKASPLQAAAVVIFKLPFLPPDRLPELNRSRGKGNPPLTPVLEKHSPELFQDALRASRRSGDTTEGRHMTRMIQGPRGGLQPNADLAFVALISRLS